jgi:hypothetical protein
VEEAMEIVEDQVEDFKEEVFELAREAEELQKSIEEAPASPVQAAQTPILISAETGKAHSDQQSRLESANFTLQMVNADPPVPQNQMEADVMSAFHEISLNRVELTPQEKVLAYEPKNAYEAKIKDLTIFKHKALDFMSRYPEATNICLKLISGVAQGWQAVKYAGAAVGGFVSGAAGGSVIPVAGTLAGGIVGATTAVSGVYATQTATEAAIDTTVTTTGNALATKITSDNVLQKEFASTIKICELGLLCAGSTKAVKALKGTLKTESKKVDVRKPYVAAISSKRLLWAGWDSYPKVIHNGKEYAKIGDRLYTEHAVSRMLPSSFGRFVSATGANTKEGMSMSPNFVEYVIENGTQKNVILPSGVKRTIYSSGSAKVYTEQGGKIVITVNPLRGSK